MKKKFYQKTHSKSESLLLTSLSMDKTEVCLCLIEPETSIAFFISIGM